MMTDSGSQGSAPRRIDAAGVVIALALAGLAAVLTEALDDPERLSAMGEAGFEAASRISLEAFARRAVGHVPDDRERNVVGEVVGGHDERLYHAARVRSASRDGCADPPGPGERSTAGRTPFPPARERPAAPAATWARGRAAVGGLPRRYGR